MADVPCSCEGVFRKAAGADKYRGNGSKKKLIDLQRKIILRGFDLLKADGEMVYATCTYNPAENEAVVNFLLEDRDADLLPIDIGRDYEPGICSWWSEKYDERNKLAARFYPHTSTSPIRIRQCSASTPTVGAGCCR